MKKLFLFFHFLLSIILSAQAGEIDSSFNPIDTGLGNGTVSFSELTGRTIEAMATQSDNKVIIVGSFNYYKTIQRRHIARLNTDGNPDLSFDPGAGANGVIYSVAVQADGKILIGGMFSWFNGSFRNNLTRLNTDGTVDETFNPKIDYSDVLNNVKSILVQPDGKIIIAGAISSYDGLPIKSIIRLNSDGSLDSSFDNLGMGTGGTVSALALLPNGKILAGGNFNKYNGQPSKTLVRLNEDGTLDSNFDMDSDITGDVYSIKILSNERILIGGNIYTNGGAIYGLIRLNSDGVVDSSFKTKLYSGIVYSIGVQSNGKIVIGGRFFYSMYPYQYNYFESFNEDGTTNESFNVPIKTNQNVMSILVQQDDSVLIGGYFSSYNEITRWNIASLNSNGSLNNSFNFSTGVDGGSGIDKMINLKDEKILICGDFISYNNISRKRIAKLNNDGTVDINFIPQTTVDDVIAIIGEQPDGKILAAGSFYENGNFKRTIQRFNTDGSIDESFKGNLSFNFITYGNFIFQPDGKIILQGDIYSYNDISRRQILRINNDGSLDETFTSGISGNEKINTIALQTDGKIIIGGNFQSYNGVSIKGIARLNPNGTLDTSFISRFDENITITKVNLLADGKIIINGNFNNYNGVVRKGIVKLSTDGNLDSTFYPEIIDNETVQTSVVQKDGKIIIVTFKNGYNRVIRLNEDGSDDGSYVRGVGGNDGIVSLAIQKDDKILIGGWFTSYNGIGKNRIARLLSGKELITTLENTNNKFQIYPNPVKDILNIKSLEPISDYEIYSLDGRKLIKGNKVNDSKIDVSNLTKGNYLIKFQTKGKEQTAKFIKE